MKTNLIVWDVVGKDDYVNLDTIVYLADSATLEVVAVGFFTEPQISNHWEDAIQGFRVVKKTARCDLCIIYL